MDELSSGRPSGSCLNGGSSHTQGKFCGPHYNSRWDSVQVIMNEALCNRWRLPHFYGGYSHRPTTVLTLCSISEPSRRHRDVSNVTPPAERS